MKPLFGANTSHLSLQLKHTANNNQSEIFPRRLDMALPPPPADVDLRDSQVSRILGVNIATFTLAVTAIVLRFIARRLTRQSLWWDDWLMLPAIIAAATMMFVTCTYMMHHGFGHHIWVAPLDSALVWAKGVFISEVSYNSAACSVKFSILAFYWRIFKQSKIRIPIYILTAAVSAWGIATILVVVFQCQPVSGFWTRLTPNAPGAGRTTCVNITGFFIGNAVPNIIIDGALLILPMPFIWQLHLPRAQKMGLSSAFILGIFVICVSIARLVYLVNLDLKSPDVTWNSVNVQLWTGVENHINITCACLPSLRPILNLLLFGSPNRTQRRNRDPPLPSGTVPSGPYKRQSSRESNMENINSGLKGKSGKTGSLSISEVEEGVCGFFRLPDRGADGPITSYGKPLSAVLKDNEILVRTEVYIETEKDIWTAR